MTNFYDVVTRDDIYGARAWCVQAEDTQVASHLAAKTVALDFIEAYEDYSSDSDYLTDLETTAANVEVVAVESTEHCAPEGTPVANGVWFLGERESLVRDTPASGP